MIIYAKIRGCISAKSSVSEIARKTNLFRNTVKNWLRESEGTEANGGGQILACPLEREMLQVILRNARVAGQ